jgi:hypothetical protein
VPWSPELFTAPALARLKDELPQDDFATVPFFPGVMTGETDALIRSFAHEPEIHHPVRGRIKGERAFAQYVNETNEWLRAGNASIEELDRRIQIKSRGVGEVVVHLRDESGPIDLPMAIVAEREPDNLIREIRMYYSTWPLSRRHAKRLPVMQPDPDLEEPDVVGEYQRALAAGDVDAIVDAFEPGGYAREPAGAQFIHEGAEGVRAFYEWLFSNGGGIELERCSLTDDGRACALEYNVVRWGTAEMWPEAGVAVYVRGDSGKLAAARMYDDTDPPLDAAPG